MCLLSSVQDLSLTYPAAHWWLIFGISTTLKSTSFAKNCVKQTISNLEQNSEAVVCLLCGILFLHFSFLSTIIGPLQILISQKILNRFGSNFAFYISWLIITKYMIPLWISTTQNLNQFKCLNNSKFSTDFVQNLDSTSQDQSLEAIFTEYKEFW